MRFAHLAPRSIKQWVCSKCDPNISHDHPGGSKDEEFRLSDKTKRNLRNCDGETNPSFFLDWAPNIKTCPKNILTKDVMLLYEYWIDWRMTNGAITPFGTGDLNIEPNYVVDAIMVCERELRIIQEERVQHDD